MTKSFIKSEEAGFTMVFDNGVRAIVKFGPGNLCEHRNLSVTLWKNSGYPKDEWCSKDVELTVMHHDVAITGLVMCYNDLRTEYSKCSPSCMRVDAGGMSICPFGECEYNRCRCICTEGNITPRELLKLLDICSILTEEQIENYKRSLSDLRAALLLDKEE